MMQHDTNAVFLNNHSEIANPENIEIKIRDKDKNQR